MSEVIISQIFLIVQNSGESNSKTSDDITLTFTIKDQTSPFTVNRKTANTAPNWSRSIDTNDTSVQLWWKVSDLNLPYSFTPDTIKTVELSIDGNDMWQPGSVHLLLIEDNNVSHLQASYPFWNLNDKLSEDPDEGESSYVIYPNNQELQGSPDQYE